MGNFSEENNTERPAFRNEAEPGSNVFVDEQALPARVFDLAATPVVNFLDSVGYIPSSPFVFENVPGNVLDDFTGSHFDDDVYFRFGNDQDVSIGYSSADDQLAFINADNEILFAIDKKGMIRFKQLLQIPSDDEENSDMAKVGTEYYLRKSDEEDLYNTD
tara:strand:- start:6042 stop:6524 length:483 start_codon:yes stop_codon:yes gene_type:complete